MKVTDYVICGRCLHQTVCRYVDLQIKNQVRYDTIRIEVEKGNAPESVLEEMRAKGLLNCPYLMEAYCVGFDLGEEVSCDDKQD